MRNTLSLFLSLFAVSIGLAAVEAPVPIRTVTPKYPAKLRQEQVNGIVLLRVTISETGAVTDIKIEKTTNEEFNEPAVEAVRAWKFKPAKKDGNPSSVSVSLPVKFKSDNT